MRFQMPELDLASQELVAGSLTCCRHSRLLGVAGAAPCETIMAVDNQGANCSRCRSVAAWLGNADLQQSVPLIGGNHDRHYITCFSKEASSPIAPVAHTSLSVPTLGEPYEAKPAGLPRDIERGHSSEAHLELPCAPSSCFVSVSFFSRPGRAVKLAVSACCRFPGLRRGRGS